MTMTVGRIPYLSYEPFYFDMPRRGIRLIDLAPRAVAEAIEQGQIDAGPAALVDCFRLEGQYRLLSGFCLVTIRKAGSVVLHAKQPIEALNGTRIGITGDAATSFRLLQILLTLKYQVQPGAYVTLDEPYDACLLIGNQGLRHRFGMPEYPHTYDLGEEWHAWTGLPFVFSHWLVRPDLDPNAIAGLEDALYVGLQDWADGLFHFAKARDDLLMHARDILEYTQGLRYFSGRPEQQAMERFRHYLNQIEVP